MSADAKPITAEEMAKILARAINRGLGGADIAVHQDNSRDLRMITPATGQFFRVTVTDWDEAETTETEN